MLLKLKVGLGIKVQGEGLKEKRYTRITKIEVDL